MLSEHPDSARVLAGGQSLIPLMNFRLARPEMLVDLNHIADLSGIRQDDDGGLRIGAMTRQWDVETSPIVDAWPMIPAALGHVGHVAIRTRGTFGGSLAHADPAAELPVVAVALGAEMVIGLGTPDNQRVEAAEDFFEYYFTTSLEPGELLMSTRFPRPADGRGWAFEEFAYRHGDFALVSVAVTLSIADGVCDSSTIVLGGVSETPHRAREAEQSLEGSSAEESTWAEAGRVTASHISPEPDDQVPTGYRRHLAKALTERALRTAAARVRESE